MNEETEHRFKKIEFYLKELENHLRQDKIKLEEASDSLNTLGDIFLAMKEDMEDNVSK